MAVSGDKHTEKTGGVAASDKKTPSDLAALA
jgi:hypothetical protein